jgi:hypothetical protein
MQPGDAETKTPQAVPLPAQAAVLYEALLNTYFGIQRTLAHDQMEGVATSADALRKQIEAIAASDVRPPKEADAYGERLQALEAAAAKFKPVNIEEAREQFGQLSSELIALVSRFPPPLGHPLYMMHCPMWDKSPSDWMQATKDIENPFIGQAMSTCGQLVNTLEAAK